MPGAKLALEPIPSVKRHYLHETRRKAVLFETFPLWNHLSDGHLSLWHLAILPGAHVHT